MSVKALKVYTLKRMSDFPSVYFFWDAEKSEGKINTLISQKISLIISPSVPSLTEEKPLMLLSIDLLPLAEKWQSHGWTLLLFLFPCRSLSSPLFYGTKTTMWSPFVFSPSPTLSHPPLILLASQPPTAFEQCSQLSSVLLSSLSSTLSLSPPRSLSLSRCTFIHWCCCWFLFPPPCLILPPLPSFPSSQTPCSVSHLCICVCVCVRARLASLSNAHTYDGGRGGWGIYGRRHWWLDGTNGRRKKKKSRCSSPGNLRARRTKEGSLRMSSFLFPSSCFHISCSLVFPTFNFLWPLS